MAYTTIKKPSDYFNTKLYTGNSTGSTEQSITGLDFSPDMVWIKSRTDAEKHSIADTVRGATKTIHPNLGDAEETSAGHMVSFDSDGYTVGVDNYSLNKSGSNYASWCWRGSDSSAVSNTDGSISSTVSANTTSGFSIVQYTGNGTSPSTVGHGLGTTPSMIILKALDSANGWKVYHKSLSTNNILFLHTTDAQTADSNYHHSPNNSTFTITGGSSINVNGNRYIAYCFAEKQGFSKFGSYTGNGNADGTFVYTGFKPAWVLCKQSSGSGYGWTLFDNKRAGYNQNNYTLQPDGSAGENTGGGNGRIDILSNGFKQRSTDAGVNGNGSTYIYMAFAEQPLVGDNPATAR